MPRTHHRLKVILQQDKIKKNTQRANLKREAKKFVITKAFYCKKKKKNALRETWSHEVHENYMKKSEWKELCEKPEQK